MEFVEKMGELEHNKSKEDEKIELKLLKKKIAKYMKQIELKIVESEERKEMEKVEKMMKE